MFKNLKVGEVPKADSDFQTMFWNYTRVAVPTDHFFSTLKIVQNLTVTFQKWKTLGKP